MTPAGTGVRRTEGRLAGAWRRLGQVDAISWPTFWATVIASVIGTFASAAAAATLAPRLLAIVIGQVLLWLPLLVARRVLLRDPGRSRPGLVLTAFFIGAALRALGIAGLLLAFYGPQEVAPVNRVTGIVLNLLPAFAGTAIVVSLLRERRRQIAELEATRTRMEGALAEAHNDLERRNAEAVDSVRAILEREITGIAAQDPRRSLSVLQATVTDVVRPMSHELARSLPPPPEPRWTQPAPVVSWVRVVDGAAAGRPFHPLLVGGFMALLLVFVALRRPGTAGVLAMLVGLLVIGLLVANTIVSALSRHLHRRTRVAIATVCGLLPGLGTALAVPYLLGTTLPDLGIALGFALLSTGATLGSALLSTLASERDRVITELGEASAGLERALVRQRQADWFQQRALSRVLHGPVQTAITAAAIRLDTSLREGSVTPELVLRIREDLLAQLDVMRECDGEVISLDLGMERIRETWRGVCAVDIDIPEQAKDLLHSDGVLRSIIIDIVTEVVSNAVRHGNASMASVTLNVVGDSGDDLLVEVTTNGRGIEEPKRRGLGTQLLDECTLTWRREAGAAGDTLTAVLPFARH